MIMGVINYVSEVAIAADNSEILSDSKKIVKSWLEKGKENLQGHFQAAEEQTVSLKLFVSSGMNKSLLKYYAQEAACYGAVMIFKGLPNNSWRQMAQLVNELSNEGELALAVQIDDPAFAKYNISFVPQLVFEKQEEEWGEDRPNMSTSLSGAEMTFDQVGGNIGIKRALELIVEEGSIKEQAASILGKVQAKLAAKLPIGTGE